VLSNCASSLKYAVRPGPSDRIVLCDGPVDLERDTPSPRAGASARLARLPSTEQAWFALLALAALLGVSPPYREPSVTAS
jgi:hypothetical protein